MTIRTTAKVGHNTYIGDDCDHCATAYDACTKSVMERGGPCCARCAYTDTHHPELIDNDTSPEANLGYTPQVGDRVRRTDWVAGLWADVLYVGESRLFARKDGGRECSYPIAAGHSEWVKVPQVEEAWANDYGDHLGSWYQTRQKADQGLTEWARRRQRIAVIHRKADGTYEREEP